MDGYMEVNFDAFVNVIDELGGVEVKTAIRLPFTMTDTTIPQRLITIEYLLSLFY